MTHLSEQPIGIFDSGIGGLTVAHAIRNQLPGESIIYFGDTAHLPYGDKSAAAIQAYSIKITDVLLSKQCKTIVIACNSASSAAYDLLKEYAGLRATFINVIDPMVDYVIKNFAGKKVGLIGTKRTIESNVYKTLIEKSNQKILVQSLATPLLVPMIEEGFVNDTISDQILHEYLDNPLLKDIDGLILGCTHYPLIKDQIKDFYDKDFPVLDSSEVVAKALKQMLTEKGLLHNGSRNQDHFMVSDFTASFQASSSVFFGEKIKLEKHVLWE